MALFALEPSFDQVKKRVMIRVRVRVWFSPFLHKIENGEMKATREKKCKRI